MAREMRGVNALEGPELGAIMAQAMRQRVRNNTTTAQRSNLLRELAMGGRDAPSRREAEEARTAEYERLQNDPIFREQVRTNRELSERLLMEDDIRRQQMLAGRDRNPPMPQQQVSQDGLGELTAEEAAVLSQMETDRANQPGDQGFTSEGYIPGGADALPGAVQPPQQPQVAGSTGTSQSQAGPQGFTSPGYVQGDQAGTADTVASNALKWLNEQFKKDEQPQGGSPEGLQPFTPPGEQGFTSPGYSPGSGQREGESFMDFTQRQHQEKYPPQGSGVTATGLGEQASVQGQSTLGMTPDEQMKLEAITEQLQSSRPDANADSSVSWPTIGKTQGAQTPGGFTSGGYNPDVAQRPGESFIEYTQRMHERNYPSGSGSADEIIGALLKQYGSQLQAAGYGEQLEKFASGNYTKADIDGLIGQFGSRLPKKILSQLQQASESMIEGDEKANIVVEEIAGLDPNYGGGTTSSGSSSYGMATDKEGNPLGFNATDYNPNVAIGQNESFTDYMQRMHERHYPSNPWVDPDRA